MPLSRRKSRPLILLAAHAIFVSAAVLPLSAQLQVAQLHGRVLDAQSAGVAHAAVVLQDPSGHAIRRSATETDGAFRIADVAPGSYVIRVELGGTVMLTRPLVVRGSLPVELTLQTGPVVAESIVVRGDAGFNTAEHPWTLAGDVVREVGEPLPSQRVQAALASLPGWRAEDNGLLHVRGVDDGLLYVQDGIPVYARLDRLFGMPPNPSAIASLHVFNGYVPPEFGFKSGAVVEVRTETGIRDAWSGTLDTGLGDLATRNVEGFVSGPLSRGVGLMLTGSDERSSRFLDPVALENFHNEGRTSSIGAQVTFSPGKNLFSGSAQGGRESYDVPHNREQEEAGQDQRQRVSQVLLSGSWQRVLSDRTVWQTSFYGRQGSATLFPSPGDTPVTAGGQRTDHRYGVLVSLTEQLERHTIKVGGELSALTLDERFSFAVTDPDAASDAGLSEAAIAHDVDNPFDFAERRHPSLASAYAQDEFQIGNRLTLNFGLRFDRSTQLLTETAWSPRIGAAWQVRPGTTLRASWLRLFQPPQAEYLLLASSEEARQLSPFVDDPGTGGGSAVPPERQGAIDVTLGQEIARDWTLDASFWIRRATDVNDPNVFFGTTVTVPNSVARQHASGFDVRLASRPKRGWSGSVGYSHARVAQFGPVTGGLFLEDEVAVIQDGTRFTPDHDQRHALTATTTYDDQRRRLRVSGSFRYQSGTPVGVESDDDDALDDLRGRPGSETVDFETGRVKPRAVVDFVTTWTIARRPRADAALSFWMNNVADQTYAFNFGNPFSGTHFGAGRRLGIALRVGFRQGTP